MLCVSNCAVLVLEIAYEYHHGHMVIKAMQSYVIMVVAMLVHQKNKSTDSYVSHLLQTSIKLQKGHTKVNVKLVHDFDMEKHESIKFVIF